MALFQFLPNGTAKMKLAKLVFLYCGEIAKKSSTVRTAVRFHSPKYGIFLTINFYSIIIANQILCVNCNGVLLGNNAISCLVNTQDTHVFHE